MDKLGYEFYASDYVKLYIQIGYLCQQRESNYAIFSNLITKL